PTGATTNQPRAALRGLRRRALPLYASSGRVTDVSVGTTETEFVPAVGRPAQRRRAPASRSGAGRPTAGGRGVGAPTPCQPLAENDDTDLKWACSGGVALQDKRLAGDRRALGDTNSVAQRDRGQPLESNPNSRLHRVVPQARSSVYSQGRDVF